MSPHQPDNLSKRFQIPVFSLQEGHHKLSLPIVGNIFLFAIFRTDKQVNVMSWLVTKGMGNCKVSRERYPTNPSRPVLQNLINVEFDPRKLPFPFFMIKAGYSRVSDASSPRDCLAKPLPSRLAGQVCKDDTIEAAT